MINILDTYTLVSFEDKRDVYRYVGTYNKKENNLKLINITIYEDSVTLYQGNMTYSKEDGITISLDEDANQDALNEHVNVFTLIKNEIESTLMNNVL